MWRLSLDFSLSKHCGYIYSKHLKYCSLSHSRLFSNTHHALTHTDHTWLLLPWWQSRTHWRSHAHLSTRIMFRLHRSVYLSDSVLYLRVSHSFEPPTFYMTIRHTELCRGVTITLCSGLYSLSWTFKHKSVKRNLVSSLIWKQKSWKRLLTVNVLSSIVDIFSFLSPLYCPSVLKVGSHCSHLRKFVGNTLLFKITWWFKLVGTVLQPDRCWFQIHCIRKNERKQIEA